MSFNPVTLIEKLIEEHGSSTIQGRHLALLKDQIAILQGQVTNLTAKTKELESEMNNRNEAIEKLKEENARLQNIIDLYSSNAGDDFDVSGGFSPGTWPGQ